MKRKATLGAVLAAALLFSGCAYYEVGPPVAAGPPPPPRVVIPEPQYLYLIPAWGVYFVPGVDVDVFFYDGLWYYRVGGSWYWGRSIRGPWLFLRVERVPKVLRKLPRDYRSRWRRDDYRVPYGFWKKRWAEEPPPVKAKPPGFLYKAPKSGVYLFPEPSVEIFRYKDRWYRRYNGVWYWSWNYGGPWAFVELDRVPGKLRDLPRFKPDDEKKFKKVPWHKKKKKRNKWEEDEDEGY